MRNEFRFNEASVTVYWTEPTAINPSCNESRYIYHLVKSDDEGVMQNNNNAALGRSNYATISRNDLVESSTPEKLYSFHVVAMDGNITCAWSINSFSMPQNRK